MIRAYRSASETKIKIPLRSFLRASPRMMNCSIAARWATARAPGEASARRARGGQHNSREQNEEDNDLQRQNAVDRHRRERRSATTVVASATTAAQEHRQRVAAMTICASTQTISPEVFGLGGTDGPRDAVAILCRNAHHQLPDAPPPPDDPPPPEKPPPPESPPPKSRRRPSIRPN